MPQVLGTVISTHDEDRHRHVYPSPIEILIAVGPSYTLASTPTGGSVLRDTATRTEYLLQETEDVMRNRLDEASLSNVRFADSYSIDAFARLRVATPLVLFDSKQIHDNKPLFWDDQEVSGSGTTSVYSQDKASTTLAVGATAGKRIRQTKMRFNYQPGKSQLVMVTLVLGDSAAGITREVGYFDDNNGMFLRSTSTGVSIVLRSNSTGSAVDTVVASSSWNVDKMDGTGPSATTLDYTKSQIFFIDFEWLGVGRIRYGFYIDGIPRYIHYEQQANLNIGVYMSTPNLPVRYSIENAGGGGVASLVHLCTTVVSEGGADNNGVLRYASTNGTHVDANTPDTIYAILGIRLKAANLDAVIKEVSMSLLSETNDNYEWLLIFNPNVADTFTYLNETNSVIQIARGATANVVTGGTTLNGGWGTGRTELFNLLPNSLYLGSLIDGTPDELVLCARPLSVNLDIQGGLTWRELS